MESVTKMEKIEAQGVPADYAALGVASGYAPISAEELRMFIVGPSGEGKSSFLMSCPRTLTLDFERGAQAIPRARAHRVHVKNAEVLDNVVNKLATDASKPNRPYDRVGFDTIDEMMEIMNPVLAKRKSDASKWNGTDITAFGDKGAGWAILKHGCWDYIKRLENLGYTWTVIGHITEKTISTSAGTRTIPRPVIFDTFARLIGRNCEVFSNIYSQVDEVPGPPIIRAGRQLENPNKIKVNNVYMDATTINSEKHTGQGKLRGVPTMTSKIFLPDPLTSEEQGWDVFRREYNSAIEKVKKELSS